MQIAIDGPVAAGKGTVARLVAQRLNLLYIDTGAMYRTAALLAHRQNVPLENEQAVADLVSAAKIEMHNPAPDEQDGRLTTVLLNGEDISWAIRTPEMSQNSSKVASLGKVRQVLVEKQQIIASSQDVIMEGRDITFRVLPNADMRIFLSASPETRAKRRHMELQTKGMDVSYDEVYQEMLQRDRRDTERSIDPLHVAPGVWELDTSNLDIEDVVEIICQKAQELRSTH